MSTNIADEIDSLFDSVKQPLSPNSFNADSFRNYVIEYLDAIDEEIKDDPDLGNRSHWNLVMDDGDFDFDGFFAVMIIQRDGLQVIAGTGDSDDVGETSDAHTIVEVDQIRSALTEKFLCKSLQITRSDAEQWLGRSLGLN